MARRSASPRTSWLSRWKASRCWTERSRRCQSSMTVIVVGAVREVARPVIFTSEDPPGGGTGGCTGRRRHVERWTSRVTRSSRCPRMHRLRGQAASILLSRLESEPNTEAVVGVDASGREQPLQLALRPAAAEALVAAAGPSGAAGVSARRLLDALRPGLVSTSSRQPSSGTSTRLINCSPGSCSPQQPCHRSWIWWPSAGEAVDRPVVIAIDGPKLLGQVDLGGRGRPSIRWLDPGGRRLLSGHPAEA